MLTLPESEVRALMNLLLVKDAFDGFDLRVCTIQSFARFDIEGAAAQERAESEPAAKALFCKWSRIRPYVYNIIKGSEKPRFFKLVLSCPEETVGTDFPNAQALFINIIFDKNSVHVTTGASMKTFSLDRGVEASWDEHVKGFFQGLNLDITESA